MHRSARRPARPNSSTKGFKLTKKGRGYFGGKSKAKAKVVVKSATTAGKQRKKFKLKR